MKLTSRWLSVSNEAGTAETRPASTPKTDRTRVTVGTILLVRNVAVPWRRVGAHLYVGQRLAAAGGRAGQGDRP